MARRDLRWQAGAGTALVPTAGASPVQVGTAGYADSGAAVTAAQVVTFTAATAGNLLVVAGNSDATLTISGGGGGWTLADSAVANQGTYLWFKTAAGGETSVTLTPSVSDMVAGAVAEFTVVATLDVHTSTNRSGSSAATVATGTTGATAQSVELVVVVAGPHSFSSTAIPASPTWVTATSIASGGTAHPTLSGQNVALSLGFYVTGSTGTQSETCTFNNSSFDSGGVIAAFR